MELRTARAVVIRLYATLALLVSLVRPLTGFTRKAFIPRFLPTPANVTYEKGGLAILRCAIEHLGTKTVIWRKQPYNVPITIGTEQFVELERFHLNHAPHRNSWDLLIKNLQPFDAGTYECQISSKCKTIRRNITLNVAEKGRGLRPAINISGTRFVEKGAAIYLLCNASGTVAPPDGLDWFKDGNLLTLGKRKDIHIQKQLSIATKTIVSSLKIDHARMIDTGTYVCRTSGLLTTGYKVDVLNAETYNVKREYGALYDGVSHRHDTSNTAYTSTSSVHTYFVISVTVTIYSLHVPAIFR